jgi:predicted DNA-binding antitoxin AbrB/MazE fold protein
MAIQEQAVVSVPAIYKDGVLRPLEPLDLPEDTQVQVTVSSPVNTFEAEDRRIRAMFAAAGVELAPRPTQSQPLMTEAEREALMRKIGPGVNASQAIIEERESGW